MTLFAVPLQSASDIEAGSFVVAESVFVFQFLSDRGFRDGLACSTESCTGRSDVGSKLASVLLVALVRRWVGVLAVLREDEERLPRYRVLRVTC
jgi:hypothetical protein